MPLRLGQFALRGALAAVAFEVAVFLDEVHVAISSVLGGKRKEKKWFFDRRRFVSGDNHSSNNLTS